MNAKVQSISLQAPLQPLQDNLESHIYETFERDTQKYEAYREAVEAALIDRVPTAEAQTRTTVLMVVGAGRGPLVKASLKAAENCGRQIRVFAVEKNPNAVITLQNLLDSEGYSNYLLFPPHVETVASRSGLSLHFAQ